MDDGFQGIAKISLAFVVLRAILQNKGQNVRIFKSKWFSRYARKEGISDKQLREAIKEVEKGQIDAVLGSGLIKKRVARDGAGKSGGYRTLIAFKSEARSLFIYAFAKKDIDNLDDDDLKEYKKFARELLRYSDTEISAAVDKCAIEEIDYND